MQHSENFQTIFKNVQRFVCSNPHLVEELKNPNKNFSSLVMEALRPYDLNSLSQEQKENGEFMESKIDNLLASVDIGQVFAESVLSSTTRFEQIHRFFENHPINPISPTIELQKLYFDTSPSDEAVSFECSVCLCSRQGVLRDTVSQNCETIVNLPCGHKFDESCILEWFRYAKTCPMCRAVV